MFVFGQAVVPADEGAGRSHAGEVFAGDAEFLVFGGAVGEEQAVVVLGDCAEWEFAGRVADGDVADEVEVGPFGDVFERFGGFLGRLWYERSVLLGVGGAGLEEAYFHFWVVGGDAEANQAVGDGERLEHVDVCLRRLLHDLVGCVVACRA